MATSQAQFDTDLAALTAAVQTLIAEVTKLVSLVQAGSQVDLTSEDTGVQSATAAVNAAITAAKSVTGS